MKDAERIISNASKDLEDANLFESLFLKTESGKKIAERIITWTRAIDLGASIKRPN